MEFRPAAPRSPAARTPHRVPQPHREPHRWFDVARDPYVDNSTRTSRSLISAGSGFGREILQHDPGLAASPPVRYKLGVARSAQLLAFFFGRPLWTDNFLAKRQRAAYGGPSIQEDLPCTARRLKAGRTALVVLLPRHLRRLANDAAGVALDGPRPSPELVPSLPGLSLDRAHRGRATTVPFTAGLTGPQRTPTDSSVAACGVTGREVGGESAIAGSESSVLRFQREEHRDDRCGQDECPGTAGQGAG
jgi:hypothetical protein